MDWQPLIDAATAARRHAHAPYSGFRVGAAVLAADGSVHAGCNVENRTFGLTLCAERVAVASAIAAGAGAPLAVVVVTDTDPPAPPCGLCRETLAEFADDLPILLVGAGGQRRERRLAALLPEMFRLPGRCSEPPDTDL